MPAAKTRRRSKYNRAGAKNGRVTRVADADYRRHRVMARSIAGRILVRDDGRMLVLGGEVAFSDLVKWMKKLRTTPGPGHDVLNEDFPFVIEGELTEYALKVRGLALHRWRTGLETVLKRRQPRRRAKELNAELREVDALQYRLERLFKWRRRVLRNDLPSGHPFFLDDESTTLLRKKLRTLNPVFNDAVSWHVCAVLWWSGGAAVDRLLEALGRFPQFIEEANDIAQLEAVDAQLATLEKRIHPHRYRQLINEMKMLIRELPDQFRTETGLGCRRHGKTLEEHLQLLREKCQQGISRRQNARFLKAPAILASLCICDGSDVPLPDRLVRFAATKQGTSDCMAIAEGLVELSTEPGYELLLRHMDEIAPAPMSTVQKLLAQGEAVEDVDWVAHQDLLDANWHSGLTPGWTRQFFEMLSSAGVVFSTERVHWLLSWIETVDEFKLLREFADWFQRIPIETFTPRESAQARLLIEEEVIPAIGKYGFHDTLRKWMRRSKKPRVNVPGVQLKSELRRSLSGIAHFRSLTGEGDAIPESWRRELNRPSRAATELAWLRTQAEAGSVSPHIHSRIHSLARQAQPESIDQDKLLRKSHRAFLIAATDALRKCTYREAIAVWENATGYVPIHVSELFPLEFCMWVRAMDEQQRAMLREIIEQWRKHGENYRRHLADNQRWLNKPGCPAINIDEWLTPEPGWVQVAPDRRIRIKVSQNPVKTFLMGQYFGSCLSLHDCNRMSALTNAYDANKQVLYIYEEEGALLGRQLVTISSKGTMLGYHCYLKVPNTDKEQRELLTTAIRDHCGRWAKRCNVPLGEEGEPEEIAGHFWYDDGEIDWPDSSKDLSRGYESSLTLFRRFHAGRSTA